MQRQIEQNGETLCYEWQKKRVKNINLRLRRDGSVYVSSGYGVPAAAVDAFVRSKWDFIRKAQQKQQPHRETLTLQDGAVLPCLGKRLTLSVQPGEQDSAQLQGDTLFVTLKDPTDTAALKCCVTRWWNDTFAALCEALCQKWKSAFARYSIREVRLRYRRMTSRWGSCQPLTGDISLNTRLLHAPMECIEYIIVHELAHLVEANHSAAFHAVVSEVMPDWKLRQKRLKEAEIPLYFE